MQPLGPILLRGSLHETIWGGRNLATIAGKALPAGAAVGESWETALDATATDGAFAGRTLGDLVEELGVALIGTRAREVLGARFPLLAKFIDAQAKLSVQVHPDDAYASAHERGALGKTEAWYILHAEPGAAIVYGLNRNASREEVRQAIAETRLEGLLRDEAVRAGDVIFVPAGTVHAIGGGIVLYELQEYSDITYRLYDYGRLQDGAPRPLHVDQALDVMRYAPAAATRATPLEVARGREHGRRVLVACRYFLLEELLVDGGSAHRTQPTSCQIVSVLGGACEIRAEGGTVRLGLGETAVLPATLGDYTLHGERARVLRSSVPDEDDPLLGAWRAAQPAGFQG